MYPQCGQRNLAMQNIPINMSIYQNRNSPFYQPHMVMALPFHPGLYQNQQYMQQIPMQNFMHQMSNIPGLTQQVYYWNPVHNGPNIMQLRLQQQTVQHQRGHQRPRQVDQRQCQNSRLRPTKRISSKDGKYPLPEAEPISIPERIPEQENIAPIEETKTIDRPFSKTPESLLPLHVEKMRLAAATPKAVTKVDESDQPSRFTIRTDDSHMTTNNATPYIQKSLMKRHKDRFCSTINQSRRSNQTNLSCNQSPIKPKSIVITAGNDSIVLEVEDNKSSVGVTLRNVPTWASQMRDESEKHKLNELRSCADLNTVEDNINDNEWITEEELQVGYPVRPPPKPIEPESIDLLTTINQSRGNIASRDISSMSARRRVALNTSVRQPRKNPGGKATHKTRRKFFQGKRAEPKPKVIEHRGDGRMDSAITSGSIELKTAEYVDGTQKSGKRNLKKKISAFFKIDKNKLSKSSSGFSETSKQSNSSQQ